MRILLASFIAADRFTGMGQWSYRIAEELAALGHTPTIWFADRFPNAAQLGGAAVLVYPLALAQEIFRQRADFDVVLIHEPSGLPYALMRRMRRDLPPAVAVCHNVESKVFGEMCRAADAGWASVPRWSRIKAPLFRLWQSDRAIRLADAVLCLSTIDRDYCINHLGVSPDRIVQMLNGVDRPQDVPERRVNGIRVLFVGGWLDIKGRRTLPVIWRQVRSRIPSATLTLIGTGTGSAEILPEFDESDRAAIAIIPRIVDRREMDNQFASHTLFLMPSISEGGPLALLEAMAARTPVLAARVGGIPDIVTDGMNGLLFDSMDPAAAAGRVSEVLANPQLTADLSEAGYRRAGELTWQSSAKTVLAAIAQARAQSDR